jgi:hypothetical protein
VSLGGLGKLIGVHFQRHDKVRLNIHLKKRFDILTSVKSNSADNYKERCEPRDHADRLALSLCADQKSGGDCQQRIN